MAHASSTNGSGDSAHQLMANIDQTLRQNLSDPFVKQALASGLDLRVFSDSVDKELSQLDRLCIADYMAECQQIASLHKRILSCDNILLTLEDLLSTFQNRLADISSEIKTVQEQSVKMQNCLQNRQAAKVRLSQFMDDMCVPEVLVDKVLNAPATDRTFIENLHELHHKLLFAKQQTFLEARACNDVSDTLEKLRIEAVKKVREFILQKLYACRKPLVNYQMHEDALLRHRFFYEFLLHHDRAIARSIKDEYIETFNKLYTAYFKQYHKAIHKLVNSHANVQASKDDLLGLVDDNGSHGKKAPPGLFSLGMRGFLLDDLDSPPVVPHALQPAGTASSGAQPSLTRESAFRSLQCALAEAGVGEFAFQAEFFLGQGSATQELFVAVFTPALQFIRQKTEQQIIDSWDLLGLLLCAVILHHYRERAFKNALELSEIKSSGGGGQKSILNLIPGAMNDYWEALLTIILSRAEFVLNRHISSVSPQGNPHLAQQVAAAGGPGASGPAAQDTMWRPHAHPLMRRAVEMAVAVAKMARMLATSVMPQSSPSWADRFTDMSLQLLGNAMTAVSGNYINSRNKDKLIFVINNFGLAVDVSIEQLGDNSPLSVASRDKLSATVNLFSEVTIAGLLPKLASTVRDAEMAISAASAGKNIQEVLKNRN